jgi:Transposase DDE domain
LSFIVGTRIPYLPDVIREWRTTHPDEAIPDGLVLTQHWPATSAEKTRGIPDRVIYYQYRHDRARRTLRGIDEQVAKAERAVDGNAHGHGQPLYPALRCHQERQPRAGGQDPRLAGWKGYTTNLTGHSAESIIDAYHQLWHIERSFRMSKRDLQARPVYHHIRESIEAHLTIVFAALAVRHWIEHQTGWSIKKFVRTARLPHRQDQGLEARYSPLPTPYPTTSATRSSRSAPTACTNLSQGRNTIVKCASIDSRV